MSFDYKKWRMKRTISQIIGALLFFAGIMLFTFTFKGGLLLYRPDIILMFMGALFLGFSAVDKELEEKLKQEMEKIEKEECDEK